MVESESTPADTLIQARRQSREIAAQLRRVAALRVALKAAEERLQRLCLEASAS